MLNMEDLLKERSEAEEEVEEEDIEVEEIEVREVEAEVDIEVPIEEEEEAIMMARGMKVLWTQILRVTISTSITRIIMIRDTRGRLIMEEPGIITMHLAGEERTMERRRAMEKVAGETRATRKRRLRTSPLMQQ